MADRLNLRRSRGFTLIELMVAVVVVAIISAVAYPNYVDSVRKSKRASAKAKMTEVAGRLEQFRSEGTGAATYTTTLTELQYPSGALYSDNGGHTLTIAAGASGIADTFVISAAPVQSDPVCGTLTLNNLGVFLPANC
jgi:type IV pilus assembly protein PilE